MEVTVFTILYTIIFVVLAQKLCVFLYQYRVNVLLARRVTGFPGTRLIQGDNWRVDSFSDFHNMSLDLVQRTRAKMFVMWVYFLFPVIILCHPDTAKVLLKSTSVPKKNDFGSAYAIIKPWIGDGLLVNVGGKKWERNRHLLTPAFHFDILKKYITTFNAVANDLLISLSKFGYKSIDICGPIKVATLDALLRCAFSYEGNVQELGKDHPYVAAIHELSSISSHRLCHPPLYPTFIFKRTQLGKRFYSLCDYVHDFTDNIITSRKQSLKNDGENIQNETTKHRDFLDTLLLARDEMGCGLSDTEIRAEADTILFAGHDTTSSAINFAIYALAKYPGVQEQVYREVMDVIGNRPVEWRDLSKLNYMLCFIKEVMRMYSTVPQVARGLSEPLTMDGITFPVGTRVDLSMHCINHHPDVWPDYETFRPERFQDKDADRDPFSYIPFSAGNRNCIGQNFALNEQRVILARILQSFRVELDHDHEVILEPLLVMNTKTGIKVFLKSR